MQSPSDPATLPLTLPTARPAAARCGPPSAPVCPACPACGQTSQGLFRVHGHEIRQCRRCLHRFVAIDSDDLAHVATVYGDDYFNGGGAGYDNYAAEADLLRAHGRRYADLLEQHGVLPGRLLDVGAACGFILDGFGQRGWQGIGLEPNAGMVARGRQSLGLDLRVGTAESIGPVTRPAAGQAGDEPGAGFDLVTMIQVIAHFHDLRQALSNLRDRTRPGGYWLIEAWDYRSLSARVAGRHWHEYSPPSVLHWFTRQHLTDLVAGFGFSPIAHGRPRKALKGSHARSLLQHHLGGWAPGRWLLPAARLIPEDLQIPYPANDVFWLLCRLDRH